MQVVATAGHVDHGKSTLVRALTGMEPDRWAEERRRGLTIDLGYAWTTLPSGAVVAFVDVPGHSRFLGNMLAGLGPAPAVLFVVAADEGWRQQSTEHLAAVDALGLTEGVLAVTRSDRADAAPALAEARERIGQSSLGRVDAVAVSGTTGAGLDDLRAALDRMSTSAEPADVDAPVRLWVDRAFTMQGSGTVVTGTLSAGTIGVDDTLELDGRPVRVRGLQSLGAAYDEVRAVARVAVNLRGVDRHRVGRGQALLTPKVWRPTSTVDVRLPADDLPRQLRLHAGTAAVTTRVRRLGGGLARLSLARPLPLLAGDRVVLRDVAGDGAITGGLIVDTNPGPARRPDPAPAPSKVLSPGVDVLAARLARAPFDAPERAELDALGLGRPELTAAVSAGRLLRLPSVVVLLPDAPDRAVELLAALPQPFTPSDARQAWGTTRRVAIPLLEHLDGRGRTRRLDGVLREVVR
ncbi:MAG: selenocysteine-specific elongation factor [Actinomycetota bacterium]|jgi:selenocysteine-specific elongation factor|nr:selenocysteine-specific elongation factor [Actinomycetota bacterium]